MEKEDCNMATRKEVYEALDTERDYQNRKWNSSTTTSGGKHSITEWLVYMQDYLNEAMHQVSRNPDPHANDLALRTIRKITAMGVSCMEQNGAPKRESC